MPPVTHHVDHFRELMARIQAGSEDAARELVEDYGEALRRAVRRGLHARMRSKFDSLDFAQIVWNSLFRRRNEFDRFDCPAKLIAYLVAMATHKVANEARRRLMGGKRNVNREESLEQRRADKTFDIPDRKGQPEPVETAIAHERWDRLVEPLSKRHRQILELRQKGHTCPEIAKIVGMHPNAVRRILQDLLHTANA
jgi:RNA polymerase sigma factor (sigma-70 family)